MSEATLERIWIKRAKRGRMDECPVATLEAGRGLVGNADQGGRRQVTIISRERWTQATRALGRAVPPVARRANLLIAGLDLEASRDRILLVGACRLRIQGETRPCERMDEACQGLQSALEPHWGGGAYAEVLDAGVIRVGDDVRWETS